MNTKILYVERKPSAEAVSIEKVFRQVAKSLSSDRFTTAFQQLRYANDTLGTIKNLFFYRKENADIYHITGHVHYIALILPSDRTILTVHDLGILRIRKGLRRYVLKKLLFDLPIRKLRYVTAVSETTKKEIVYYTKCDAKKIKVIENPLQKHFHAASKKKFNGEFPIILQIGTTANKNLRNLIKALQGISCQLNIIGELGDDIVRLLREKRIIYLNKSNLNNEEIREEYANADIVTFCSTFEGFGLPIIEAQAMLTPVVTSDISPLREVAGGESAAALADPFDCESIRNSVLQIINDENYRKNLVEGGVENIKKYEPKKIAFLYENLYREISEKNLQNKIKRTDD
jgi:glycosyltransferase involved in cell wall biosynthesis